MTRYPLFTWNQTKPVALFLCLFSCSIGVAQALKIVEVRVPARPLAGSTVRLECIFDLETDVLYNVKWYKDQIEFYRFAPGDELPHQFFTIDGIHPTVKENSSLNLENVNRYASGRYRCEVSTEAPSFRTVSDSKDVLVVEPPDAPGRLEVVEVNSDSVKLQWSRPLHDGNSVIKRYVLQHSYGESWRSQTMNVSFPVAPETTSVVRGLKPATTYHFRVFAENRAGRSGASPAASATTADLAIGGPPTEVSAQALSAQTVKLTWKPPGTSPGFGDIRGYYVGHRPATSTGLYVFASVDSNRQEREQYLLTSLSPATRYSVIVQAFSDQGTWPPSEEVIVETLHSDPPSAPLLRAAKTTSTTVSLTWKQPRDDLNPVTGYRVQHREAGGEWHETNVPGKQSSLTVDKLECGSTYQFAVRGYNEAGTGNLSEVVSVKTDGTAPVASDRHSLLHPYVSSVLVMLGTWQDGGCPINKFTVKYKRRTDDKWTALDTVSPRITISGLSPATAYMLQVTAQNGVGATEAEYVFFTLSARKESLPEMSVPSVVTLGKAAILSCSHDFDGVPLHSVKWFKDNQEFYRSVPSMGPPRATFEVEGVNVNEMYSGASTVYLEKLSASNAGNYRCEVSSGPPLNRTAVDEKHMLVAERLPVTVRISTDKEVYRTGETMHLNCTADRTKPPLGLFLSINDQPMHDVKASLDTAPDGLQTVTVRTSFLPEQERSKDGGIRVKCTAVSKRFLETAEKQIKLHSQQRQHSAAYSPKDECLAKAMAIMEKAWAAFSEGQTPNELVKQKLREDI